MSESGPELRYVRTADIRLEGEGWDDYLLRYGVDAEGLMESTRTGWIVAPVIVEGWQGGYRVIAGFRRVAAAKAVGVESVAAAVHEGGALTARGAFLMALKANAPGAGLSDADRAVALAKAKERFGFGEEELAKEVAELVGLPRSVKVVREFVAMAGLPSVVLDAVASGERSREHASAVLLVPEEEREAFWTEFVEALRLTASETRAFAAEAGDVGAREGRTVLDVLRGITVGAAAGSPAERKAIVRAGLERRASPVMTEMEEEFEALARELGLPAGAKVEHSRSFETDEVTLTARAGDEGTLAAVAEALRRGAAAGTFAKMMSIARRKGEGTARP